MLWLTQPFPFKNASILKVLSPILFDEPTILCTTIFLFDSDIENGGFSDLLGSEKVRECWAVY